MNSILDATPDLADAALNHWLAATDDLLEEASGDQSATLPAAAFYGRVSTDQQDLRTQLGWATRAALDRGFRIPEEAQFLDADQSGRKPLSTRPAGGRLWQLLQGAGLPTAAGPQKVKAVFVALFDRWGRNPDDTIRNLTLCHEWGVKVFFQDVPQFNPDDPSSVMVARMRATFAEYEVGLLRQRLRGKFAEKRARSELCGHPAYGYRRADRGGVAYEEEDHATQVWLAYMLQKRAEGWGYERIATALTRQGAPRPVRWLRGVGGAPEAVAGIGPWNPGSVRNIVLSAQRRAARAKTTTTP